MRDEICCFDIEVVLRDLSEDEIDAVKATIQAPSNYKDEEKITAYIQRQTVKTIEKLVFNPAYHKIVCICAGLVDQNGGLQPDARVFLSEREEFVVGEFFKYLDEQRGCKLLGFNCKAFDLPALAAAAHRHDLSLLYPVAPADVIDIAKWPLSRMSLRDAGRAFSSLDKTDSMDGSMVGELWREKRYKEVADYCQRDVEVTADIYMNLQRVFSFL